MAKEVRGLLNEARNKLEIIQGNRETHKLIAETLLNMKPWIVFKLNRYGWKNARNSEHELEEAKPLSHMMK